MLQAVSRDAVLSTRHFYVLMTARSRLSLPVLELTDMLSIPVVRKPFELEVLLTTVAQVFSRVEFGRPA
jgi:hypothetical protein